jgi:apolipoprotein N-acyltransferase
MNQTTTQQRITKSSFSLSSIKKQLPTLLAGFLLPMGFAPFHLPGLAILGIALFFFILQGKTTKQAFTTGFTFGLGCLGLGVSWVYVSIHEYGHLNSIVSAMVTLLFIVYLAIYTSLMAGLYAYLSQRRSIIFSILLFSSLWAITEYLRSIVMGGFPWLLLGYGQIDTPLKHLLPILGVYGVSFFACIAGCCLTAAFMTRGVHRFSSLIAFVFILVAPSALQWLSWTSSTSESITVGVIQANKSMRDKWDESLFWELLNGYAESATTLVKQNKLVVMPESAIPIPTHFINDYLDQLNQAAIESGSSILLGTMTPSVDDDNKLHNAMIALGEAQGVYQKQHLVPFGEYIPKPFKLLIDWMAIPISDLNPGETNQPLVFIQSHPIASLICYELAYPELLRRQLPLAEWIVSISDDGWFGHSFAMYQQLQMAQAMSLLTGRYQVVANNDGLSSIINAQGEIIQSIPAYEEGVLESRISPIQGSTPWVFWGDYPILIMSIIVIGLAYALKIKKINNHCLHPIAASNKRRYSYQPI